MTNANTYTYEIDLATKLGGMTRARGVKKGVQEFLSTDPLAGSFSWLSPYNFASNSPIRGIDLWGLQLLDANDALINIRSGVAMLKMSNQSNPTKRAYNNAKPVAGTYADGASYITSDFSIVLGNSNFFINVQSVPRSTPEEKIMDRRNPGFSDPKNRAQRRANESIERTQRKVPGGSRRVGPAQRSVRGGRPGGGAGTIINETWNTYVNNSIASDFDDAAKQMKDIGRLAVGYFQESLDNGMVLPEALNNPQAHGDIINYIFQGQIEGQYSNDVLEQIIEVSRAVMHEHNIEDRTAVYGDRGKPNMERL